MAKRKEEIMEEPREALDIPLEIPMEAPQVGNCDCGKSHLLVDEAGNKDSKTFVYSDDRSFTAKASDAECKKACASKPAV